MTCNQCQRQLPAYVDGSLARHMHNAVETHVNACAECADALAGERKGLAQFAALLDPVAQQRRLRPAACARIAAAGRTGAQSTISWWSAWRRPLAAAAALLALVGASSICSPSSLRAPASPTPCVMLASSGSMAELTNTLSLFAQTACFAPSSDTLAVNTVHRVSW